MNMDLRKNSDGTCNCRPFNGGCFFISSYGGPCDCECHKELVDKPEPVPWEERFDELWKKQFVSHIQDSSDIKSFISQELESAKKEAREEMVMGVKRLPDAEIEYQTDGGKRSVKVTLKAKFTKDILNLLKSKE